MKAEEMIDKLLKKEPVELSKVLRFSDEVAKLCPTLVSKNGKKIEADIRYYGVRMASIEMTIDGKDIVSWEVIDG